MTDEGPQFIYLLRPTREGVVLVVGRTQTNDERTFGLVIFRAADEHAARALADPDPAVGNGIMSAEVFPFRIALQAST